MTFEEKRKVEIVFTDEEAELLFRTVVFLDKFADKLYGLGLYSKKIETIINNTTKGINYIRDLEETGIETEDISKV